MPLPDPTCEISTDVCCAIVFDAASNLLTALYTALQDCVVVGPCQDNWLAYVTMGQGDDAVRDALSVALLSMQLTPGSQQDGNVLGIALAQVTYRVRILESGWPMAHEEGNEIFYPEPVLQNALARHVFAHSERVYRSLVYQAKTKAFLPDGVGCSACTVAPWVPLTPLGGTVGGYADLSMTIAV